MGAGAERAAAQLPAAGADQRALLELFHRACPGRGLGTQASSWFWLAIGLAGPLGGLGGALSRRLGLSRTNVGAWTLWAVALAMLAMPGLGAGAALISAALFGATYMGLTGLCIVWAARLYPSLPAHGVTLSFLLLGIGQTLGSPMAGALADHAGLPSVFAIAAACSLLVWLQCLPVRARR